MKLGDSVGSTSANAALRIARGCSHAGDAIDLIDEHLPKTLRFRPAWREVKETLVIAAQTRTGLAVDTATTLLEHVLEDEGWLVH
jgi:hypothetical protein